MVYHFLSYTVKSVMGETTSFRQLVINDHPFNWLAEKMKLKRIEEITIISFQQISQTEFENFPDEKVYMNL